MTLFFADKPYNALPSLPPKIELETKKVLKSCIEARAAIAELKQCGALIPNQGMLINTIPVLEAQASSAIENIVTTADKLFQFSNLPESQADPATKEALRYGRALYSGFVSIKSCPLVKNTAVQVCSAIKGVEMEIRKVPGTALIESRSRKVIYTPPEGESLLREKLDNWENFIHCSTEIDPLVRLAVMHYQFEAIHPFSDGNGRTGRILNILFLIEQGLLEIPVLYLSRYIISQKQEYYQRLIEVTVNQDWQSWILFMLEAVRETAIWTTRKIQAIRELMEMTIERIKSAAPETYSRELVEVIFTQPYSRIKNIVDADIAKRQTASTYLKKLCEIGVLREEKVGREKLFIQPKFLSLLVSDQHQFSAYS